MNFRVSLSQAAPASPGYPPRVKVCGNGKAEIAMTNNRLLKAVKSLQILPAAIDIYGDFTCFPQTRDSSVAVFRNRIWPQT